MLELGLQWEGVDDVAVVGQGQPASVPLDQQGLRVAEQAASGGGVTGVSYGQLSGQGVEISLPKNLGDQAHLRVDPDAVAVGCGDSRALLAAVLQGKEAEKCQAAGFSSRHIHPDDPTLIARAIREATEHGRVQPAVHSAILCSPRPEVNLVLA